MALAKGIFMEVMLRGGRALAKGTSACWHLVARVAFLGVPSTVVSTGAVLIDSLQVRGVFHASVQEVGTVDNEVHRRLGRGDEVGALQA